MPRPDALDQMRARRLAGVLAAFVVALHRVPVDELADLGLDAQTPPHARLHALRDETLPILQAELGHVDFQRISNWWDEMLADETFTRFRPTLVHGDLWYENLLVDTGSGALLGVLDWEDAALGDPAQDLATQWHLGAPFARAVLRHYRADGLGRERTYAHRVRRWWELRELDGIIFAARTSDRAELADAIRKLRSGPILAQE